jgi:hypothetical protein
MSGIKPFRNRNAINLEVSINSGSGRLNPADSSLAFRKEIRLNPGKNTGIELVYAPVKDM